MGLNFSDLVIESVINEGLAAVRRDSKIIDDIFSNLKNINPVINKKFGDKEIARIKKFFTEKEVTVSQAFPGPAEIPCISIQLVDGTENLRYSHLDDYVKESTEEITDEKEKEDKIRATDLGVLDFDPITGTLEIDPSDDISSVVKNNLFVDVDNVTFPILWIIDSPTDKRIGIAKNSEPNVSGPCEVKSQVTWKQREIRGNVEDEKLLVGIHTEERLLTIYLFQLVKYFILSRKKDLMNRGFNLSTYNVSDFSRNQDFRADHVYSRYITVSGITENEWESDVITPLENLEIEVLVKKDVYGNEELGLEDQTVKLTEE